MFVANFSRKKFKVGHGSEKRILAFGDQDIPASLKMEGIPNLRKMGVAVYHESRLAWSHLAGALDDRS